MPYYILILTHARMNINLHFGTKKSRSPPFVDIDSQASCFFVNYATFLSKKIYYFHKNRFPISFLFLCYFCHFNRSMHHRSGTDADIIPAIALIEMLHKQGQKIALVFQQATAQNNCNLFAIIKFAKNQVLYK